MLKTTKPLWWCRVGPAVWNHRELCTEFVFIAYAQPHFQRLCECLLNAGSQIAGRNQLFLTSKTPEFPAVPSRVGASKLGGCSPTSNDSTHKPPGVRWLLPAVQTQVPPTVISELSRNKDCGQEPASARPLLPWAMATGSVLAVIRWPHLTGCCTQPDWVVSQPASESPFC